MATDEDKKKADALPAGMVPYESTEDALLGMGNDIDEEIDLGELVAKARAEKAVATKKLPELLRWAKKK